MEFLKKYMVSLSAAIKKKRELRTIYPEPKKVFTAFKDTPLEDTRVFISGQDPYHNGNANGVAFGVDTTDSTMINCSLKKIFDYLEILFQFDDISFPSMQDYSMGRWTSQGVLMLNRILTVEANKARSHAGLGWEIFTNRVVKILSDRPKRMVFMLWGVDARELREFIDHSKHLVLTCEHPAAACYNESLWKGKKCFKEANEFLKSIGEKEILW